MEQARALLSSALDSVGWICIWRKKDIPGKKDPERKQKLFAPGQLEAALDYAFTYDAAGWDTYFGTSTFKDGSSREAINAHRCKVIKIDFDIDPNDPNKHPSIQAAMEALDTFLKLRGWPQPTIVVSGYGLHVYWILATPLEAVPAKRIVTMARRIFESSGLKIDGQCTSDISRVLRLPGTLNHKRNTTAQVFLFSKTIELHDTAKMVKLVEAAWPECKGDGANPLDAGVFGGMEIPAHAKSDQPDPLAQGLVGRNPKSFARLLKKSLADTGSGCHQIKYCRENRKSLREDEWFSALSIAKFCDDQEYGVKELSEDYPDYDFETALKKIDHIKGPHTCRIFKDNWPLRCEGCKHWGKIKSPIMLGEYIERATAADEVVTGMNPAVDEGEDTYELPPLPPPYFRGKGGGIYLPPNDEDELDIRVSPLNFYVVSLLKGEDSGYLMHLRVHHLQDGIVDFIVPTADIGSMEWRKHLNDYGIMVLGDDVNLMRNYIKEFVEMLQRERKSAMIRNQFGWTKDRESFVIGAREITKDKPIYSRAAPNLLAIAKAFSKSGTLEGWRAAFNTYNQRGLEPLAFGAMLGFASPLMALTGHSGVLVNLYHNDPGTGKSTCQIALSSIWGDPSGLILHYKDTSNARYNRMGVYQNMPVCIDEMTHMPEEEISDLLFSVVEGRGKHRMTSSANTERLNDTKWSSITVTSANRSFHDVLQVKGNHEAELVRLFEIVVAPSTILDKAAADTMRDGFLTNYGHAGDKFIKHVITHMPTIMRDMVAERTAFDKEIGTQPKERFWSALCTCVVVGGRIAKSLDLHDYDMEAMRDWMVSMVNKQRNKIAYTQESAQGDGILGEFLNLYHGNILVFEIDQTHQKPCPTILPKSSKLVVRYERHTNTVFIEQKEFRDFCNQRRISLDEYLTAQRLAKVYYGVVNKRLSSGSHIASDVTRAYEFRLKEEFEVLDD